MEVLLDKKLPDAKSSIAAITSRTTTTKAAAATTKAATTTMTTARPSTNPTLAASATIGNAQST